MPAVRTIRIRIRKTLGVRSMKDPVCGSSGPGSGPGMSRRNVLKVALLALMPGTTLAAAEAALAKADVDPRRPTLDLLCDLVIPPTDTPGGAEAGAAVFALLALDHGVGGLRPQVLDTVMAGLDTAAGASFASLPRARAEQVLTAFDAAAFTSRENDGSPAAAWRALKPALVVGYYSTEVGASQELVYEPVPGPDRSNFKLTPAYRARSNEGFGGSL